MSKNLNEYVAFVDGIRRRLLEFYNALPPPRERSSEDNKVLFALQEVFGVVNNKGHQHLRGILHERHLVSVLEESQKILKGKQT